MSAWLLLALLGMRLVNRATTLWDWKDPADAGAWDAGHDPRLEILMRALVDWLRPHGIRPVVTSYVVGRGSGPHLDGRAIDVRTRDWPPGLAAAAAAFFSATYPTPSSVRAVMPTAIYETPATHAQATAEHLHLQVARLSAGSMPWYGR